MLGGPRAGLNIMHNVASTGYDPRTLGPEVNCYIHYETLATSLHCTIITFKHMPISGVLLRGKKYFSHHLPHILCSDVRISVVLRSIAN